MKYRNLVIINGEAKELKSLPEEERKRLADAWNRKAAEAINYKEVKNKSA